MHFLPEKDVDPPPPPPPLPPVVPQCHALPRHTVSSSSPSWLLASPDMTSSSFDSEAGQIETVEMRVDRAKWITEEEGGGRPGDREDD